MEKSVKIAMLKGSVKMAVDDLLNDKSSEFKDAFYLGMQFAADYQKELLDIYLNIGERNS